VGLLNESEPFKNPNSKRKEILQAIKKIWI
jgi:hypothetical protein